MMMYRPQIRALLASLLALSFMPTSSAEAQAQTRKYRRHAWAIELGQGVGTSQQGDYIRRLEQFEYQPDEGRFSGGDGRLIGRFSLALERTLHRNLSVTLQANSLDIAAFERVAGIDNGLRTYDTFRMATWAMAASLRVGGPLPGFKGGVVPYLQAGIGPTFTHTRLKTHTGPGNTMQAFRETHFGYQVAALAGLNINIGKTFGMYLQGGYHFAPALENELGDRHNAGGGVFTIGFRTRLGSL